MVKDYSKNKESLCAGTHYIKCKDLLVPEIQKFISKIIKPPTYQITLGDICSKIREVFGVEIAKVVVAKFLKNKLNYVF